MTKACTGSRRTDRSRAGSSQQLLRGAIYEITARKALEVRLLALNETLEARVAELRQEARYLEILNDTGVAVAAERDLTALVQTVTDAGVQLTHAEFGAFFYNVMREDGEAYTLYTLSGVPREAFAKFPMPRNTAIFEPTFRGRGPVRSDDILADPRYGKNAPHKGMPEGHLPVRSYLASNNYLLQPSYCWPDRLKRRMTCPAGAACAAFLCHRGSAISHQTRHSVQNRGVTRHRMREGTPRSVYDS